MREKRRFAALLAALALAACLIAVPAVATEGTPPLGHTQMPGDATGTTTPQNPETDPVTPEPATPPPDPVTPPPSSSSSQEPSSSSSSQEPSDSSQEPSSSSSSSSEEPSDSSQDPGSSSSSEDPGSSSSQEPSDGGDGSDSSSEYPESEDPWEEPSQSQEEPDDTQGQDIEIPDYEPQTIATPRPAVERPSVSLNNGSSTSSEEEESGPNYVTFARLNVKGNSMASTLFIGGVACVVAGVMGLVAILLFYLRGRRRYSGAEGILQEIHEAEVRQQPAQGGTGYPEPPAPVVRKAPPGALMPEEASLYTEEFSMPQEDPQPYQGEYDQYDGYDDYDDYGDYDDYQDEGRYGQYQDQEVPYDEGVYEEDYPEEPLPERPETTSPPAQEVMGQTRQFDTEEILREALRFTDDDYKN